MVCGVSFARSCPPPREASLSLILFYFRGDSYTYARKEVLVGFAGCVCLYLFSFLLILELLWFGLV
jgi:hypothetical protein